MVIGHHWGDVPSHCRSRGGSRSDHRHHVPESREDAQAGRFRPPTPARRPGRRWRFGDGRGGLTAIAAEDAARPLDPTSVSQPACRLSVGGMLRPPGRGTLQLRYGEAVRASATLGEHLPRCLSFVQSDRYPWLLEIELREIACPTLAARRCRWSRCRTS
jgi:hypothetical protein